MREGKGFIRVFSHILAVSVLAVSLAMVFASCGDDETTTTTSAVTAARTTATTATTTTSEKGMEFKADLKGEEEVPTLSTGASGEAEFKLSDDGQSIKFEVKVSNITDVSAAHIHIAAAGSNGPIAVPLFTGSKPGQFSGTLAEGTITAADLTGPLAGMTLDDLISQMKSGNAYCNVHTAAHAAGEIRGQMKQT